MLETAARTAPPMVTPMPGSVLILDPLLAEQWRANREGAEGPWRDEVWEGVTVASPMANLEHQGIVSWLIRVFSAVVDARSLSRTFPTINISDRDEGWTQNYRGPDAVVILDGNPGIDRGTHWQAGPDFLVEVLSKNDLAREKLSFYAAIGVREVLIVDRAPWALELHRLADGELRLVGVARPKGEGTLESEVLPLRFRLGDGPDRPAVVASRSDGPTTWAF